MREKNGHPDLVKLCNNQNKKNTDIRLLDSRTTPPSVIQLTGEHPAGEEVFQHKIKIEGAKKSLRLNDECKTDQTQPPTNN